jgi:hypothetical protein
MMICKECGRKRPWPNLKCYPAICLKVLIKTTKNHNQDSQSPGRESSPRPPKYQVEVLTNQSRRLVVIFMKYIKVIHIYVAETLYLMSNDCVPEL